MSPATIITLVTDYDGHYVFFEHGKLTIADEPEDSFSSIALSPQGLRLLAKRLAALADLVEGDAE